MSASLAMRGAPLERRAEDRWLGRGAPVEKASRWMGVFLLASVGLHAAIVATALFAGAAAVLPPEKEIAVEIVQEAPQPPREAAKPAAQAPTKPDAPAEKAPPLLRTAAAPTPSRPDEHVAPRKATPVQKSAAADDRIKALQSELEALRAARAELETERAAQAKAAAASASDRLGPLPDSFQAVALPSSAEGVGEAMDYQAIVFSQLAKAKGIGGRLGLPGSAGVRFEVDAQGKLTAAEVVVSSGVPSLDAEALAIVRKAAPFPAPPQGAQRVFSANVNFVTEAQK